MKAAFFLAIGIAVLAALFFAFKPAPEAPAPAVPAPVAALPSPAPATPAVDAATVLTFDIEIAKGKLARGPEVIKIRAGDEITMRITSDAADELHLHGYDRHAHLKPGVAATLKIKATKTGRFAYELHKSGVELGVLEVHPR